MFKVAVQSFSWRWRRVSHLTRRLDRDRGCRVFDHQKALDIMTYEIILAKNRKESTTKILVRHWWFFGTVAHTERGLAQDLAVAQTLDRKFLSQEVPWPKTGVYQQIVCNFKMQLWTFSEYIRFYTFEAEFVSTVWTRSHERALLIFGMLPTYSAMMP